MLYIEKEIKFEAAHLLPNHDGKCARLHGHSWRATITIAGAKTCRSGPKQGMLVDYADLSALLATLHDVLDHRYLNTDLPILDGYESDCIKIKECPTSEALAFFIFFYLASSVAALSRKYITEYSSSGFTLDSVTVRETCTSACTLEVDQD